MKLIIANTKMYLNTLDKVERYLSDMSFYKESFVVAHQSIYIERFINSGFVVASQSVSSENDGAYTGEISPRSLSDLGVQYVIVGHAEVRNRYSDEDKFIREKVSRSLENNLKVILCVGENTLEKDYVFEVLDQQLDGIKPCDDLFISYEPIWAIGGSNIVDESSLKKIISYIKKKGYKNVLYGGSITGTNIAILNRIDGIDGFLIGSRSVDSEVFKEIIEVVK